MDKFLEAMGMDWATRQLIAQYDYGVGSETEISWNDDVEDDIHGKGGYTEKSEWQDEDSEPRWMNCQRPTPDQEPTEVEECGRNKKPCTRHAVWCGEQCLKCTMVPEEDPEEEDQRHWETRRYITGDGKMKVRSAITHRRRSVSFIMTYERN